MRAVILMAAIIAPLSGWAADARTMLRVIACESGWRHDAVGDDGLSMGIAQFRKETFYEFSELAKKDGVWPKRWRPEWLNPQQQIFLLEWGLDHGYGKRWTCWRKIVD